MNRGPGGFLCFQTVSNLIWSALHVLSGLVPTTPAAHACDRSQREPGHDVLQPIVAVTHVAPRPLAIRCPSHAHTPFQARSATKWPIWYQGFVLSLWGFPLWRKGDSNVAISVQWEFPHWEDGIFLLSQAHLRDALKQPEGRDFPRVCSRRRVVAEVKGRFNPAGGDCGHTLWSSASTAKTKAGQIKLPSHMTRFLWNQRQIWLVCKIHGVKNVGNCIICRRFQSLICYWMRFFKIPIKYFVVGKIFGNWIQFLFVCGMNTMPLSCNGCCRT